MKNEYYIIYNFVSNKIKIVDTKEKVCKITNTDLTHFSENFKDKRYISEKYGIYSLSECIDIWRTNSVIKLPKRFIQKLLAEKKNEILDNIITEARLQKPELFRPLKIYALNDALQVVKILEGHKEASEHFNIPIGTVKSRLNRAVDIDFARKFKMCKMEDYRKIVKENGTATN